VKRGCAEQERLTHLLKPKLRSQPLYARSSSSRTTASPSRHHHNSNTPPHAGQKLASSTPTTAKESPVFGPLFSFILLCFTASPPQLQYASARRPETRVVTVPATTIGTRERHGSSNSGLRHPDRHRCAPSLSFFFLHETDHFFPRATTRRSQSSSRLRGFARRRLRSTIPAVVGVTPAPTHPNPCLSSSAREKGVVTPSTRHHRADHTATRFEDVTRSRSTVVELRIAGGYSLVFLFFVLICVGLFW